MRQVMLVSDNRELVTWLDDKRRVKIGDVVTLKNHREPMRRWAVTELYGTTSEVNRDWHVGGL